MGIDLSLFDIRRAPRAPESPENALMRGLEIQRARQGNALQAMQMQAFEQKAREEAAQRAQALAAQQQRQGYLASVSGQVGPPQPFNPLEAYANGLPADAIKALTPAPQRIYSMGPGAELRDAEGRLIAQTPFKPEPQKVPPIGELQAYRDQLPKADPRRREVQSLIDNQTRAPKYAMPAPAQPASGSDGGQPMPDDRLQLSRSLGVPIAERDPYAGMSPKAAEIFKRNLYTAADKKLNEFSEASRAAQQMAQDAKRFVELQAGVGMQGPIAGRVMALSSDAQDMDAITAKITPQMRQPGSGATSDFDAKMFQMSTVSRTKNDDANKAIAEGIVLNAQVVQEREQFMRDFLTVNGHLDGADRQWKRYIDANPIFDPKSPKVPALNAARVPYQQFFAGKPAAPTHARKTVTRTGTQNGRKVVQYSDGSIEYAD